MQSSQIQYRSALALDLIASLLRADGRFNQNPIRESQKEGPYNILYHLQAASVLFTGGQFLQKKNVTDAANKAVQIVDECEFESKDSLIFVFQEKSLTIWNALSAILCFKQNNLERGIRYIKTILPCVEKKRVHPYIRSITSSAANEKADQSTVSELGIVLLALLMAYNRGGLGWEELKIATANVGNQVSGGHLAYSGYNAWGLTFLSTYTDLPFYLKRRDMMARSMMSISTSSMTSLFAAMTQQTLNACGKPDLDLLQYQCDLQVSPKSHLGLGDRYEGAFVRKKRFPEVRIDYTIHSVLSFLQYLEGPDIHIESTI